MKNIKELGKLMLSNENLAYNEKGKAAFKRIGKKAMKELATLLQLQEFDVNFNPGGIAVSGDLRLMGMWKEGNGVYISMNKDFPQNIWGQILYRTIKDMKDYFGGSNNYLPFEMLLEPEKMVEAILKLKD